MHFTLNRASDTVIKVNSVFLKGLPAMKFFLFLISSFIIQSLQADVSADAISAKEEKKVLTLLNNFCGDSWCEGAYDIHFKKIEFTVYNEIYILAAATPIDGHYDIKDIQLFAS